MKVVNLILCLVFLVFAAVQLNDPDPWLWVAMYALVAVICGLAAFGNFRKNLILLGLAVCAIEMFQIGPEFVNWIQMGTPNIAGEMKAEEPHIEYAREFLGLVLCAGVLIWQYFQAKKWAGVPRR